MIKNFSALDNFEVLDEDLVRVIAPNMDLGFRQVAYIGYADQAGVTKH